MGLWNGIGNGIGRKKRGIDWSSYWKTSNKVLFLWSGKFDGDNLLSDLDSTVITVTGKDFSTSYIPYTSAATFAVPDNATYEAADTDLMWFDGGGTPESVGVAELVGSDYERTIIKYDNADPYHIRGIMILKAGEVLTADEINRLHADFDLWIFWSLTLNANGVLKDNRPIVSKPVVVSAAISNAAPDKVVVTFDQDLDESSVPIAADFVLDGKTISGIDITDAVLTLTVSIPYSFDDVVLLDYVKPASGMIKSVVGDYETDSFEDQAVTNSVGIFLDDTHTLGWFDYKDTSTLTDDGGGAISKWEDKLNSGNDLLATLTERPTLTANGLLFNGTSNFMKTAAIAAIDQPTMIYLVFKQITWAKGDTIFDGNGDNSGRFYQQGASNNTRLYNSAGTDNTALTLDTYFIVRIVLSNTVGGIQINDGAFIAGNYAAVNMGGFTLGRTGATAAYWCNMEVKEIIIRDAVDTSGKQSEIMNYLNAKYSIY